MSENDNKGGGGIFWAILLFLGGSAAFAINKLMGKPTDTTTDSSTIDGTTTGTTGGNPKNITPKPTVDKYAYGSQVMDGAGTAKNSNSDIEVSITDLKNKVIKSQYKFQYNEYIYNLGITNKLTTTINVEHILLLFFINGVFKGSTEYAGMMGGTSNPLLTIKSKSNISKVLSIKQTGYAWEEDQIRNENINIYFSANMQNLPINIRSYNYGHHYSKPSVVDAVTGISTIPDDAVIIQDWATQYNIDKTDTAYLEDIWDTKYTLTVKGLITYKKNENDVMDGGNIVYLDLVTNHAVESVQPFTSIDAPRIQGGSGGSGGVVPTCKSKYGIGSYMPKSTELNTFYQS